MDTFVIKSEDGGMKFKSDYQRGLFKQRLQQLEGKEFAISIDERKPTRSENQNRFYWLYIGIISEETGYTKDELHTLFKGKFLSKEIKEVMNQKVRITKSTTDLNKSDFSEYIMEIQTFTGITPPDTQEWLYGEN